MILYTDRTQGATSLKNGQIEVMYNRRIQSRDSKGIGEPLNELDFTTRKGINTNHTYYLQIRNNVSNQFSIDRGIQSLQLDQPQILYGTSAPEHLLESISGPCSNLLCVPRSLTKNLRITMTPQTTTEWLIRFDNFVDQPKWHNLQLIIDYMSYKTLELTAAEDVLTTNRIVEYTHAGALSKKSATDRKMLWFREEPVKLIENLKDVEFDAMEF